MVRGAVASQKMTAQEGASLKDSLRHDVDTSFGTRHEGAALDAYESRTGWQVAERNERFLRWDLLLVGELQLPPPGQPAGMTAPPRRSARRKRRRKSGGDEVVTGSFDL
eukprot:SAG22_NODE_5481_length_1006_cov_1.947078_1_plen_108_part_10